MPAKSKAQQKFMGMVHAAQKGDKAASAKVAKVAKRMKKKDAEDYASTKHKGLPNKVKKEALLRLIAKYGAKRVKETIMAVRPKSVTVSGNRMPEDPDFEYDPEKVTDEGFGGELKGKDKEEFEKARKENAEVLGYEATGTSDTKKQTLKMAHQLKEGYTLYSTDKRGKKVKKIKTYGSKQAAAVAMGKFTMKLDTDYFPKNVDGLMYIKEGKWSMGLERYKVTLENGKEIDVKVKEGVGLKGIGKLLEKEGLKFEKIIKKASRPTLTPESVKEEITDWQGKYDYDFKFKKGQLVKDINPDCPHHGSEGEVTKVTKDEVTYTVRNNGRTYKVGDELTKTKEQLTPLSVENVEDENLYIKEERDYKAEYKKFQSSTKAKKYRAELNQYNRKKGTYGNGDKKDASHKSGKIAGFEKESTNRGRREKSRLKGEVSNPTSGIMMARVGVGPKFSSPEAKVHVNKDVTTMSKFLGKASQQVIKTMMDGVKSGKYDAMDLARGIQVGPIKRTHYGETDFIQQLWNKVREKFRRYSKRGKLR